MEFVVSNHAKKRMVQRDIPSPNKVCLRVAKNKAKKLIIAQCKKLKYDNKFVYFRTNDRDVNERSIYVCKPLDVGKYLVITVFKLKYTEKQ